MWCWKAALCVVCWAMFFLQIYEVFLQFSQETSTTGIQYSTEDSLELPHITVCPRVPFKQPELPQDERTYVENTFALHDIFHDPPDPSLWNVTEMRSFFNGLCFVLRPLIQSPHFNNGSYSFLNISSNASVDVFLHTEGMEVFVALSAPRPEITTLRLEFESDTKFSLIKLTKSIGRILKRREGNCRDYSTSSAYSSCVTEVLRSYFQSHISCVMPNYRDAFLNASAKPQCVPNSDEYKTVFDALYNNFDIYKLSLKDCPDPCSKETFEAQTMSYSGYTLPSYMHTMENSFVQVGVYYETFIVETSIESVMYNFTQLLAAVGGSLGLFLGFSCYSLLCDFVDIIVNFRSKRENLCVSSKAEQTSPH